MLVIFLVWSAAKEVEQGIYTQEELLNIYQTFYEHILRCLTQGSVLENKNR